jgi:hypothetical protein
VDEKPDFGSTTSVLARRAPGFAWLPVALRQRLTPAALGSAIAALAVAITYVVNAQHDLARLKESMVESKQSIADLQRQLGVLPKIDTQLAVLAGNVGSIADEVDRQREWRDRIEGIAETPPHARRRTVK